MKSIKRRFNAIKEKNPGWADHICFSEAIRGKKFKVQTISRNFHKIVDKDDFSRREKKQILEHLFSLSEYPHDDRKQH